MPGHGPVNRLASAELIKLIRIKVRPGHRDAFLKSQEVWNRESATAPGYLGEYVGDGDPGEMYVLTFWRSRPEYLRWMEEEHDRIAANAGADRHYEELDIRLIDRSGQIEDPGPA